MERLNVMDAIATTPASDDPTAILAAAGLAAEAASEWLAAEPTRTADLATGTPAGVGPVKDGDTVRITIERVGEMNVKVVQGSLGQTPVFEKPYTPDIIKQR